MRQYINGASAPLKIFLADLAYSNRNTGHLIFVPLGVAYLASYAKKLFGQRIECTLFKDANALLSAMKEQKPDLLGFSTFFWNEQLNYWAVTRARRLYGDDVVIMYGGPSIDTDPLEQELLFDEFPEVDFAVPDEGETAFSALVERMLAGGDLFSTPIAGAVCNRNRRMNGAPLIRGESVDPLPDLAVIPSPYLDGTLAPFLDGGHLALLQTSRACPYSCAYCVSGRRREKLRTFPLERVKAEIEFVATTYCDRPYANLHLCDDNFGVHERDVELAQFMRRCSDELGYPRRLEFYSDKQFNERAKKIIEALGGLNFLGLPVSLQSLNPDTLRAIHRRNLDEPKIREAIGWAAARGIDTSTELIFGLPYETRDSFLSLLEKCIEFGFDRIQCYNLLLLRGSELSRRSVRLQHGMETRLRVPSSYLGNFDGDFVVEKEEIVTGTSHCSFDDFMEIRCVNFLFHAVFSLFFQRDVFHYVRQLGVPTVDFFRAFVSPEGGEWPRAYVLFLEELKREFAQELTDTYEQLVEKARGGFKAQGGEVGRTAKINLFFGARLIYLERAWVREVMLRHIRNLLQPERFSAQSGIIMKLLDRSELEWIRLPSLGPPRGIDFDFDVVSWRREKYRKLPGEYAFATPKRLVFSVDQESGAAIEKYIASSATPPGGVGTADYYFSALESIFPRSRLIFSQSFES